MPDGGWEREESRTTWPRVAGRQGPACLQESPSLSWRRVHRAGGHQARVPDCRRSGTCSREPSSFLLPRSSVAGLSGPGEARGGSAAGFGVLLWSAGSGVQPLPVRAGRAADAGAAVRLCPAEAGTPPNSTVCARWTRRTDCDPSHPRCLPRSAGASRSLSWVRCLLNAVATRLSSRPRGWLHGHLVIFFTLEKV